MEYSDIIALAKAGYTKDEIYSMAFPKPVQSDADPVQMAMDILQSSPEPAPAQNSEPAPVAQPAVPAQVPAPVPAEAVSAGAVAVPVAQPQPVPQPAQEQPTMAQLMESIAKLTSAVQANAIAQSVIPGGLTEPPKAEDMLAEIIRPTYKGRE